MRRFGEQSAGAALGNCSVLTYTDAVLRAALPGPYVFAGNQDLRIRIPYYAAGWTTVTFLVASSPYSTDEAVALINATVQAAGDGYARNIDGTVEIVATRALANDYSEIYIDTAAATSPAAATLGFYAETGDVYRLGSKTSHARAYSGDLQPAPYSSLFDQNPDGAVMVSTDSVTPAAVNRGMVALASRQDLLSATKRQPFTRMVNTRLSSGVALATATLDVQITAAMLNDFDEMVYTGCRVADVGEFFKIVDAEGLPIFDSVSGDQVLATYVTTGVPSGAVPVQAAALNDNGYLNAAASTYTGGPVLDINGPHVINSVRAKSQVLLGTNPVYGGFPQQYLGRIQASNAEPNNNGYWRIRSHPDTSVLQLDAPVEVSEDPVDTIKPYLTEVAASHGSLTVYSDGQFFHVKETGGLYLRLNYVIPAGITAYLILPCFCTTEVLQQYHRSALGRDDATPNLTSLLQTIRTMKGPFVQPNEEVTVDPLGDATPISLEDLHNRNGMAGTYSGASRSPTKGSGSFAYMWGDGIHLYSRAGGKNTKTAMAPPRSCANGAVNGGDDGLFEVSGALSFVPSDVGNILEIRDAGAAWENGRNVIARIVRYIDTTTVMADGDMFDPSTGGAALNITMYQGQDYGPKSGGAATVFQSTGYAPVATTFYPGLGGSVNLMDSDTTHPLVYLDRVTTVGGKAVQKFPVSTALGTPTWLMFNDAVDVGLDFTADADLSTIVDGIGWLVYYQGSALKDGWYQLAQVPAAKVLSVIHLDGSAVTFPTEANTGARVYFFKPRLYYVDNSFDDEVGTTRTLVPATRELRGGTFDAHPAENFGVAVHGSDLGAVVSLEQRQSDDKYPITSLVGSTITLTVVVDCDDFIPYLDWIRVEGTVAADGIYVVIAASGASGVLTIANPDGTWPALAAGVAAGDVYRFRTYNSQSKTGFMTGTNLALPGLAVGIRQAPAVNENLFIGKKSVVGAASDTHWLFYWDNVASTVNFVLSGSIEAEQGNIEATLGNITATVGTVHTLGAAGHIYAALGNIYATAGDVYATAGDVYATAGDIRAVVGDVIANSGGLGTGFLKRMGAREDIHSFECFHPSFTETAVGVANSYFGMFDRAGDPKMMVTDQTKSAYAVSPVQYLPDNATVTKLSIVGWAANAGVVGVADIVECSFQRETKATGAIAPTLTTIATVTCTPGAAIGNRYDIYTSGVLAEVIDRASYSYFLRIHLYRGSASLQAECDFRQAFLTYEG